MFLVNRGIVVLKPRQPFLDWINSDSTFPEEVTLEELQQDCVTLLVPDLWNRDAVLQFLEPLKAELWELMLSGWTTDQALWPRRRTSQLFEEWFAFEVHSEVHDLGSSPPFWEEEW